MSKRSTRPESEEHDLDPGSSPLDPPKGWSSPLDPPKGTREVEMQSDCERTARVLHRYVEGELDPIRDQIVERHLAACPACLSEKEELDLERLWLVETALEGPVLSTRLVGKVMESVRREAVARSRSRWWRRTVMATAAACLFAVIIGYSSGWSSGGVSTAGEERSLVSSLQAVSFELSSPAVPVSDREGHLSPAERRLLRGSTVHVPFAHVWPIERGGFRNDLTNPTFVNFGLPNVSCLPQAPEDIHDGLSCEVIVPAEGGTRRPRTNAGQARVVHVRTTFRFKFRDTFGIALRLKNNKERNGGERNSKGSTVRPRAALIDLEPCVPDPNSDGKTDSGDIAYGLQVLYGAQPPDVYDVEPTALDPECEGSCLRA